MRWCPAHSHLPFSHLHLASNPPALTVQEFSWISVVSAHVEGRRAGKLIPSLEAALNQ